MTPCFLTSFEHLSALKRMVADVTRIGGTPIVVDNGSTYPPLLEWLDTKPCHVTRLGANFGPYAYWSCSLGGVFSVEGHYVVSDSDLDLSGLPDDALSRMAAALAANPTVTKVGLSLEIDDIPADSPLHDAIMKWERPYWSRPLPGGVFDAKVDTTFALYHTDRKFEAPGSGNFFDAVRMGRPYTARHLPWYTRPDTLDAEQRWYFSKVNDGLGYWSAKIKKEMVR